MDRPKTEPSADIRTLASTIWQAFVALKDEGFSEHQALIVVGQMLAATMGRGDEKR